MAKRSKRTESPAASLWPIAAAILVIAGAVLLLILHVRSVNAPPQPAPSVFAGDHYPSQGHQGHMPGDDKRFAHFRYSSDPPTSGYHREVTTPALINAAPLPKFVQVHLLEHGNILLQYNCLLCPDVISQLTEIANEFNSRLLPAGTLQPTADQSRSAEESGLAVIVAPYPGMSHKIALTAWTRLATLDDVDKSEIMSFINQWLHNQDNLNQ